MKTAKDFIIKHWNPEIIPGECEVKHFFDEMDRVMQLYSDQQNKELREELEKWKSTMTKHHDELVAENVKLIQQAGFANTIQEQMMTRIEQDIADIEAHDKSWNELKVKTDHQIKIHEETIQRLTKEVEELRNKQATIAFSFPHLVRNGEEITRLTKEVELLKNDLLDALDLKKGNGPTALTMLSNELTRLRELLERAKEFIPFVYINGEPERHTSDCKYPYGKCRCHLEELLTEIDNALNHKP